WHSGEHLRATISLDWPASRRAGNAVWSMQNAPPKPPTGEPFMAVEPLIYELSKPGRRALRFPQPDVPETELPDDLTRDELCWPEVSEIDVIRHFTRLSQKNHAIDINMYPLGSCTMKYNPKINEEVARYP